jgi:hypothetical protein
MLTQVEVVGLDAVIIEIIRPHRIKCMPESLGEAEGHASGSGEDVY